MIAVLVSTAVLLGGGPRVAQAATTDPYPGQLTIIDREGKAGDLCPLKGTRARAQISGFGARVTVQQTFVNPSASPIEAVYTFPLPEDAAVDQMVMKIGDRIVQGEIHRREDARRIYNAAKQAGQTAALLDQERPNIFTQSVANIMPKAEISIEISYVQILKYERDKFEFVFPMVVGPRFLGNAKDPDKIAPPITPKGTRTGSNIELSVEIDAGAPIESVESVLHAVRTERRSGRTLVTLSRRDEIPNRDFILRYSVATGTVRPGFLSHYEARRGGFFSLVLIPPKAPTEAQIANKEMVFVMDQSGSQGGFPIQKSKELTLKVIRSMRPGDTFNVFGFNNTVRALWPQSRPNTPQNLKAAENFVNGMAANGGTQLLEGLKAALANPRDPERLRIVVFNTDGYVGDEEEILKTIARTRDDTRIFTFGIGNSVNRYLVEGMSREGRGACQIVTLAEDADKALARFLDRTRTPVLTDVEVEVEGAPVTELTPTQVPDVFSDTPIVVHGRYRTPGNAVINVRGRLGGKPWSRAVPVVLGAGATAPAVMPLWARSKIESLETKRLVSQHRSDISASFPEQITAVALEFAIMSEYTSFVAVEKRVVNVGGKQRTVRVPVEMAHGVSYEGIFGREAQVEDRGLARVTKSMPAGAGTGGGGFNGVVPANRTDLSGFLAVRQRTFKTVVDKRLHSASGTVEVEVWLAAWSEELLEALKKAGLKVEASDEGLKVVFGSCDAKTLRKLVEIKEVARIKPLE